MYAYGYRRYKSRFFWLEVRAFADEFAVFGVSGRASGGAASDYDRRETPVPLKRFQNVDDAIAISRDLIDEEWLVPHLIICGVLDVE